MQAIRGVSGKTYALGAQPFASGGEGYVYAVQGSAADVVAKLFRRDSGISAEGLRQKGEKIRAMMVGSGPMLNGLGECVAWPRDALLDERGCVIGFVMKRFSGVEDLEVMLPMSVFGDYRKRVIVAHNLCDVVDKVHAMGQCIGDMRPSNFGIDRNTGFVCAFDADSFHIVTDSGSCYPCTVGLPEYYAPEILDCLKHGTSLSGLDPARTFTRETDLFALAVLLFQLLMDKHPFTSAWDDSAEPLPARENIRRRRSPYFNPSPGMRVPVDAPPLNSLSPELVALFRQALLTGRRPTARQWQAALRDFLSALVVCPRGHSHWKNVACPWCGRQRADAAGQWAGTGTATTKTNNGTAAANGTTGTVTNRKKIEHTWRPFEWMYLIGTALAFLAVFPMKADLTQPFYNSGFFLGLIEHEKLLAIGADVLLALGMLSQWREPAIPAGLFRTGGGTALILVGQFGMLYLMSVMEEQVPFGKIKLYQPDLYTAIRVMAALMTISTIAMCVRKFKERCNP